MHTLLKMKFAQLCCFTILFSANFLSAGDKDIIAHWNFDEGQGSVLHDVSGNGNDGTIHGGEWVEGKSGKAIRLNYDGKGSHEAISIPDASPLWFGYGDFSFGAWIKVAPCGKNLSIFTYHYANSWNHRRVMLGINVDGKIYVHTEIDDRGESNWTMTAGGQRVDDNQWHFAALTRENTKLFKIYIDGIKVAEGTSKGATNVHNMVWPFTIGGSHWWKGPRGGYEGVIDEVTIHKRALSANEIRKSYNLFKEKSKNKKAQVAEPKGNTAQIKITDNNGNGEINSFIKSSGKIPVQLKSYSSVAYNGYLYITGKSLQDNKLTTVCYAQINSDGNLESFQTSPNSIPIPVHNHSSVVNDGYLYVTGGWAVNIGRQNKVYYTKINSDGSIGSFTTSGNNIPIPLHNHSSVIYNGYIYITGGQNNSGYQNTVYYAKINSDGSIGNFTTSGNNIPTSLCNHSSVVNKGYLYITGGYVGSYFNTVYYAKINSDGDIGSFTKSSNNIPTPLHSHSSVVNNGYLYITGGYGRNGLQNTVYYAKINSDGSIGSFTTSGNNIPTPLLSHSSVVNNGYLYITGASTRGGLRTTIYFASFCVGDNLAKSRSEYKRPQNAETELAGIVARRNFNKKQGNLLRDSDGKGIPFVWIALFVIISGLLMFLKWIRRKSVFKSENRTQIIVSILSRIAAGGIFVWIMTGFRFVIKGGRYARIEMITHNPLLRMFPLFKQILIIHCSKGSLSNSITFFIALLLVRLMPFVIMGGILLNIIWLIRAESKALKKVWIKNVVGIAVFAIIGLLYFPRQSAIKKGLHKLSRYYVRTPAVRSKHSVKFKNKQPRSEAQKQAIAISEKFDKAMAKYKKGKYKQALRGFKKLLDKVPDKRKPVIKNNMAAACIKLGKYEKAEKYLKELKRDNYKHLNRFGKCKIALISAYLYFKMGELERSVQELSMINMVRIENINLNNIRNWFQNLDGCDLSAKFIIGSAKSFFVNRKSGLVLSIREDQPKYMVSRHSSGQSFMHAGAKLKGITISDAGFAFMDVDNDNINDFVYADSHGLKIIYGSGRGQFFDDFDDADSVEIVPEQKDNAKIETLCAGDFNGDGVEDIFFTVVYGDKAQPDKLCCIYGGARIAGDWLFESTYPDVYLASSGDTGLAGSELQTGDFNGDGVDDIAVIGGGITVYYGGSIPSTGDMLKQSSFNRKWKTTDDLGCLADLNGSGQSEYVCVKTGDGLYIDGKRVELDSINRAIKIKGMAALDLDGDKIDEIALFISGEKVKNIGNVKREALYILKLKQRKPARFEEYVYPLGNIKEVRNVSIVPSAAESAESLYFLCGVDVFNLQGEKEYFVKNRQMLEYAKDYLLVRPYRERPFDDKYPLMFKYEQEGLK